jgi:hypothetical protein
MPCLSQAKPVRELNKKYIIGLFGSEEVGNVVPYRESSHRLIVVPVLRPDKVDNGPWSELPSGNQV